MTNNAARIAVIIGACTLATAASALATLGMGKDSVAGDRKAMSAKKVATTAKARYTVQEMTSDATSVREYLTPDGIVFAVAWNGRTHGDLPSLLGTYNAAYQRTRSQLPRTHGEKFKQVQAGEVVVETWGHMRNLQGRAYLPAVVPEGVHLDEIR